MTTLVAATGYGKSIVLEGWTDAVGGVLHRLGPADRHLPYLAGAVASALADRVPGLPAELVIAADSPRGPDVEADELSRAAALAGALTEALSQRLGRSFALVFDGVDVIAGAPGPVRFVETLIRAAPRHLHVVTASRGPLPFATARLRQDHEVLDLDATDLALTPQESAEWTIERLGPGGSAVAAALHRACGGWPAAVQAALDTLARTDPALWPVKAQTMAVTSGMLDRLTLDAYEDLTPAMRELLRAATVLPVLTEGLARALDAPPDTLSSLTTRGLFLEADQDGHRLTATAAHVLAKHARLDDHAAQDVAAVAARWYVEHERPEHAMRAAVAAEHADLVGQLLAAHGPKLAERGDDLLAAIELLPEGVRESPQMLRLAGIAEQNRGDWNRAKTLLGRAADGPAFDAFLARRLGLIDHLRGDLDSALSVYTRGMHHGSPPADAAMCAASAASVLWLRGRRAECAELADRALEQARALGDPAAMAAAHTVFAMISAFDGERRANDAHYLRALEYAERAGDIVQLIRIRANRASHYIDEAAYLEALAELEIASRLSELVAFAPYAALTVTNRAKALIGLGRLEEAAVDAADAVDRWEALGSQLGYGLNRLARIQWLRGDRRAAAATYRRAIEGAERTGDAQGMGTALNELAELLITDHPEEAARLSAQGIKRNDGMAAVRAKVIGARIALADGRDGEARAILDEVEPMAVGRRDHASLAAATEIRAELERDQALADLAVRRWTSVGDPIGLARAELVRAALGDAEAGAELAGRVRARMHAIGCRVLDDRIDALLGRTSPAQPGGVVVETLGTFRVLRGAQAVPRTAWQSRKARDLLKILISRRGGAVGRERLVEILWPEQEDEAVGLKRLNVMVSTLRAVLDPAHERELVISDDGALSLNLDELTVDVERFLGLAAEAVRLDQAGDAAGALERWKEAEAAYTGEFCEEDPYADWAVGLREEARLAYTQAAARLAEAASAAGRPEEAARYWLRLLERDRYDERAHLGLVRVLDLAGRRGDARRRYHLYAERMRELEVEPAPYPT
ncbi:BTAD domain-containing putative transcriptional regulator [Nonomuraea sp. NPDC050556]|uniref:BTAD domain-containing putative transcriptional regulator n=1 Tax=Nonomuraea sp. NPDC050556 TaxID=3364369 RepID=UPI0037A6C4E0